MRVSCSRPDAPMLNACRSGDGAKLVEVEEAWVSALLGSNPPAWVAPTPISIESLWGKYGMEGNPGYATGVRDGGGCSSCWCCPLQFISGVHGSDDGSCGAAGGDQPLRSIKRSGDLTATALLPTPLAGITAGAAAGAADDSEETSAAVDDCCGVEAIPSVVLACCFSATTDVVMRDATDARRALTLAFCICFHSAITRRRSSLHSCRSNHAMQRR